MFFVAALSHTLTGGTSCFIKCTLDPVSRLRLYTAWFFLCILQICVGLGIEGSIAAGVDAYEIGYERGFLTRAIFFLGLNETMFFWSNYFVKPVVDDTVFGILRENKWSEKAALAMSFGGLWWWRLRDEVEFLVVVVEKKRDLLISIGLADFVGWWLYYLTVTIGMIKIVKSLVWVVYVMFGRRVVDINNTVGDSRNNDEKDDQFHLKGYERSELVVNGIEEDCVDIDSLYSICGLINEENTSDEQVRTNLLEDQQQSLSDWTQNHFPTNTVMPLQPVQIQSTIEAPKNDDFRPQVPEPGNSSNEKPKPFSLGSLELLKNYGRLSKKSSEENLSTNALSCEARLGLCMEETRDVELVHLLLAAAEEVNNQQFHLASKLISRCMWVASDSGNPVQRLSFYFAKALEERIDRSTGRYRCTDEDRHLKYIKIMSLGTNFAFLTCHQLIPFSQVMQFAGVQTIVENVRSAKKIHLIDFNIRSGIQWIVLIQALAEKGDSPIELKITAVGSTEKENLEVTSNTLHNFAKSLGLSFSFDIVFVSDMKDFKKESVNITTDETVAVYCNSILRTMLPRPDCLDKLMKVVRSIGPTIIVVGEVEANHNSPSFLNRFIETLYFYSAFFDCFEDCMDRGSPCRTTIEGVYFGEGIRNIVAAEGEDRFTRNVKLEVWRAFFARFGMVEEELSESAWYQAHLILKQFAQGSSCDLQKDGKGLIIGWKGRPIYSLSIWKFFTAEFHLKSGWQLRFRRNLNDWEIQEFCQLLQQFGSVYIDQSGHPDLAGKGLRHSLSKYCIQLNMLLFYKGLISQKFQVVPSWHRQPVAQL
ncbi:hypothetical protein RDI58_001688 [Solanum bulbocastanum]|uniref:GRAS family transcription factor n=1 Tax=Solanum bulbocastanum TaxID=147425 RepID=A0AAN8U5I7_SOLBU